MAPKDEQPGSPRQAAGSSSPRNVVLSETHADEQDDVNMQLSPPLSQSFSQSQSQTQTQTQLEPLTQMDCTQHSQSQLDETSNPSPLSPLSPPAPLPWARLVPSMPSPTNRPIDLMPGQLEYWLGRSSTKCQIPIAAGVGLTKKENFNLVWAHSMISNLHCKIQRLETKTPNANTNTNANASANTAPSTANTQLQSQTQSPSHQPMQVVLEDQSGNGTIVNQTTHLRKGDQRILHSGDEICLVNPDTLRKRITSHRMLQTILQQYTYIFVLSKPKRSCVNPRAMNYRNGSHFVHLPPNAGNGNEHQPVSSPRSSRRIEAHYDIREVLGDGTSGQVRRAIHRQTGQEYAVKVVSLRRHFDIKAMEHEVSMMQSLDHPYIVQLVDVFVQHGVAMYLVMELIAGGDLFDSIVEVERYTEVDARRVMRRLLSAVYYLHETKNVVHRDLKPENILCSSPTHVKLADFGLAKMVQSDGLKTFCGTPQYFAPEVLQRRTTVAGAGRYGKPADIWSLGVILYILLSGRPPFGADLDPLVAYENLEFDDPCWSQMPQAQDMVRQLLRLDPKRRLSVRQACDHPWIQEHDGDTHVHPLDDPAVTARKRLFSEACSSTSTGTAEESAPKEKMKAATDSEPSLSTTAEKEPDGASVLSKKDFAAAAMLHQRDDSIGFINMEAALAEKQDNDDPGTPVKGNSTTGGSSTNSSRTNEPMDTDEVENKEQANTETVVNDTPLESPSKPFEGAERTTLPSTPPTSTTVRRELSVTPSDCGDDEAALRVPRSPLASMNLNERSNRFREQVLGCTSNVGSVEAMVSDTAAVEGSNSRSTSPVALPDAFSARQMAATPTTSNATHVILQPPLTKASIDKQQTSEGMDTGEALDDPILSQFSSEPSSLGSFPDSPAKKPTTTRPSTERTTNHLVAAVSTEKKKDGNASTKKRLRLGHEDDAKTDEDDDSQPEAKRTKATTTKSTKQTKLSAWFAPKQSQTTTAATRKTKAPAAPAPSTTS